jgi:hypothetical protein
VYCKLESGFKKAGCRWLTPVIPATQEAEIRKTEIQSQPRQIVHETLSQKNPSQKRSGVAQGEGRVQAPVLNHKNKSINNLGPAVLAIWETEIRRTVVQGQPKQILH